MGHIWQLLGALLRCCDEEEIMQSVDVHTLAKLMELAEVLEATNQWGSCYVSRSCSIEQ